jgi:transcriptional regulator with XRE-family HTH domain
MTGKELRQRRERLGLSAAQLGAATGYHRNTIWRWERGEVRIKHPQTLDLALATLERAAADDPAGLERVRATLALAG